MIQQQYYLNQTLARYCHKITARIPEVRMAVENRVDFQINEFAAGCMKKKLTNHKNISKQQLSINSLPPAAIIY